MNIAFVDGNGKRVMIVNMGDEVQSVVKLSEQACDFINIFCDSLGWRWEPMKQPRSNSRILSYAQLKEIFLKPPRGDWVVSGKEPL